LRLALRQFDVQEIEPTAGDHGNQAGRTDGEDVTKARLHCQPATFADAAQE